jgi:hypothetical protein
VWLVSVTLVACGYSDSEMFAAQEGIDKLNADFMAARERHADLERTEQQQLLTRTAPAVTDSTKEAAQDIQPRSRRLVGG